MILQMVMTEAAKAAAAAAAAGQEGSPPLSPSTRQPNTAEHLVLYGASKVADRLTRWEAGWCRRVCGPVRVPWLGRGGAAQQGQLVAGWQAGFCLPMFCCLWIGCQPCAVT